MADQSDRQSPINESGDEKTKRCIKEFIKMVRNEIREWRFCPWHIYTILYLQGIKSVMGCIEKDLLGKCSITGKDCKDYMDEGITMIDFTLRIRDEIKKHNFPENIRVRIEIIEPHLKIFERHMKYRLGLDISKGYPTVDDFLMRKKEILVI